MLLIHVRPASPLDASAMAGLLNAIIDAGGMTAYTNRQSRADILDIMAYAPERSRCLIAEDDHGDMLGFQMIEPHPDLPPEACDIATFTRLGNARSGIGSALFRHTTKAARALGYGWINATIRSDNAGGLAYYQSRGFEPYARLSNVKLGDGTVVDKICTRYDL